MSDYSTNVLKTMRNILADHWYKGGITDGNGNFCIMGAMNIACFGSHHLPPLDFWEDDTRDEPCKLLQAHLPARFEGNIAAFNDAPDITHTDVLTLIDEALTDAIADAMGEQMITEIDEQLRKEAEAKTEDLVAV